MFYLDLFSAFERHRVRYLLVGGLAMNLHGVPRTTMDIDLVIALDDRNKESFVAVCTELRLRPVAPVTLAELFDAAKRREWMVNKNMVAFGLKPPDARGPTVDVLIEPALDLEAAFARALWRDLGAVRVALASVEDLIRLKENTGRAQDQSDIEHLRRIAGGSL